MKIKYFNEFNDELTNNQINNSINYYKVYFDIDDNILNKEYIKNGTLFSIHHFLNKNENKNEIIDNLLVSAPVYIYIITSEIINGNRLELYNIYKENKLIRYSKKLYDHFENVICDIPYFLETNTPDYVLTTKYYYDKEKEFVSDLVFRVSYDHDGSLLSLTYNPEGEQDSEGFGDTEEDISELASLTGKSENFIRYYMNGNILPPPSN